MTPERWTGSAVSWKPKRARLTDAAVIFTLLMLPRKDRAKTFPFDFDADGNVRLTRVPLGTTVVITQNNIRCLLAWCDTY